MPTTIRVLLALLLFLHSAARAADGGDGKPNVIYILADDLGIGDLGCYGQKKLATPNIDRLADEGMRFTDHYSGNTVCSPSRAVLMTGRHPGKVHCRGNGVENSFALDPEMTTLPRLFRNAGYATGAFGKWGLGTTVGEGAHNPMAHGFDHFTGWKSQTIAHTYYPSSIVRNGREVDLEPGTFVHDLIMDDAFAFIRDSAAGGKPFFCYIPTAVPHAAMHAPPELHEKWRKAYPEFDDRTGTYQAGPDEDCPPVVNPIAGFAAMMENLDNQIGGMLDLLAELGIDDNTLVMFASDNGTHIEGGHDPDFWDSNGVFRGHKRDLYEGGIRTPFLARWPARIRAGSASGHISAFQDVLPTMAAIIGQEAPEQCDGISMLPTLEGRSEDQRKAEFLYFEFIRAKAESYTSRAIRIGDWKLVQRSLDGRGVEFLPMELYDLVEDPGEATDLASRNPDLVRKMSQVMDRVHVPLNRSPGD